MIENIRLSFQGIWSHKMRSFLTMLGIIIGIASIISIVSTINGTSEQIKNNLIGAGNNVVQVQIYQDNFPYDYQYLGSPDGFMPISDEIIEEINKSPYINSSSRYTKRNEYSSIYYSNISLQSCEIFGIDENYFQTMGYDLVNGRLITQDDYDNFRTVIVIDKSVSDTIFSSEDPIGKVLEIQGTPFTIIGVVKQNSEFEPVINTIDDYYMYKANSTNKLFISSNTWPLLYGFDEPESLAIQATQTETMTNAGNLATEILNKNISKEKKILFSIKLKTFYKKQKTCKI